jgi:hypothetical protein
VILLLAGWRYASANGGSCRHDEDEMRTAVGIIALLAFAGVLVSTIAVNLYADEFFAALIKRHPAFADAFPKPSWMVRYAPIRPSYVSFLSDKGYLKLSDPDLREQGARVRRLLHLHAVGTVTLILFALWWRVGFE